MPGHWDPDRHRAEERINNRYVPVDTRRLHVGVHLAPEKHDRRMLEAENHVLQTAHARPHRTLRFIMPENQRRNPFNQLW